MTTKRLFARLTLLALMVFSSMQPVSAGPQANTYIVNSDTDAADANPGDGVCATSGGNCTLHAAIQEANLDGGTSTINFASLMKISYPSLPGLTENGTLIDASNRWDATYDRPGVWISGGAYPLGLLHIFADSCIVRGIEFSGGDSVDVYISGGSHNIIGGNGSGQRNVFFTPGKGTGVWFVGGGSQNTISGNCFGTWNGITATSNYRGIFAQYSSRNTIKNNLIVGSTNAGIELWWGSNIIKGNIIGADKFKFAALPNAVGIFIYQDDLNIIGPDNFIAGNTGQAIYLKHSQNNSIFGNQISPWTLNFGNGGDGIRLQYSNDNLIGGTSSNDISNNTGYGVYILGNGNIVQGNYVRDNGQDGVYVEGEKNKIGGAGATKAMRSTVMDYTAST